jgi:hypothetical protein
VHVSVHSPPTSFRPCCAHQSSTPSPPSEHTQATLHVCSTATTAHSPWPPASRRPHTQSNINCTPSRWWGRSQRVSIGSTSIALSAPPPWPAAAAAAAAPAAGFVVVPSAPTAAAAAAVGSEGSQRIKGSMPGGSVSRGSGCGCCCCCRRLPGCWAAAGSAGCTKGLEAPHGTKCLRASSRLRRAWEQGHDDSSRAGAWHVGAAARCKGVMTPY